MGVAVSREVGCSWQPWLERPAGASDLIWPGWPLGTRGTGQFFWAPREIPPKLGGPRRAGREERIQSQDKVASPGSRASSGESDMLSASTWGFVEGLHLLLITVMWSVGSPFQASGNASPECNNFKDN